MPYRETPESLVEMFFYNAYIPYIRDNQNLELSRGFLTYLLADLINHPEEYSDYIDEADKSDESQRLLMSAMVKFITTSTAKQVIDFSLKENYILSRCNDSVKLNYEAQSRNYPKYYVDLIQENFDKKLQDKLDKQSEKFRADINGSIIEAQSRLKLKNADLIKLDGPGKEVMEQSIAREHKILEILSLYTKLDENHTTPTLLGSIPEPGSPRKKRQEISEHSTINRKKRKLQP